MKITYNDLSLEDQEILERYYVLHKIKKQSFRKRKDNLISYQQIIPTNYIIDGFSINVSSESEIIGLFIEEGILLHHDPPEDGNIDGKIGENPNASFFTWTYLTTLPKFDEVFIEYQDKYRELKKRIERLDYDKYFYFEGKNFILRRSDNSPLIISLKAKKGGTPSPFYLMRAYVEILKKKGNLEKGWLVVKATKGMLLNEIPDDKVGNDNWFKSTKSNLANKKLPEGSESYIKISTYNRTDNTYDFALKILANT